MKKKFSDLSSSSFESCDISPSDTDTKKKNNLGANKQTKIRMIQTVRSRVFERVWE